MNELMIVFSQSDVNGHAVTVLTKTGKLKTDQSKHQKKVATTQNNMKKNYLKLIGSTLIVGAFLFFSFGSGESKKTEEPSNDTRNTYQEQVKQEPEKKECYSCKGSGIITCTMCNGTGINNMGMDCGCVTYVANCRTMGKEPTRTALQWTCEHCNGTGYEK